MPFFTSDNKTSETLARFAAAKADLQREMLAESLEYENGLHNHYCANCHQLIDRRCGCLKPLIADWCSADCHRVSEL